MAKPNGKAQNLDEGGQQAFTALINSILPDAALGDRKVIPDAVQKLSEKLSEIVGEDAAKAFREQRNERGELLNEEGLPIIDITEPISVSDVMSSGNTLISDEDPFKLVPLAKLQLPVRERLRQQRDRVLDLLEEEERVERLQEEQKEQEEREEALRKRKEALEGEKEKLKAAKALQQKMGKALLRSFEKGEEEKDGSVDGKKLEDKERTKQSSTSKKKTVAFVTSRGEDVDVHDKEVPTAAPSMDWGDVSIGRLRPANRPTLLSQTRHDSNFMKMNVVERVPAAQSLTPVAQSTTNPVQDERDSDDESVGGFDDRPEAEDEEMVPDSGEASDARAELEQEEVDLDFAQHQREIALEYHKKRNEVGKDAIAAMTSHSHEDEEYTEPELDMPVSESSHPTVSRFKANRLTSAYNVLTSIGASVIPESSARTIQRAIRTGKVDADEHLVGGEADSASEEENEGMQEVLELLKKGEMYNLGPDGKYIHTVPPRTDLRGAPESTGEPSAAPSATSTSAPEAQPTSLPPLKRPQTSKFKASRAQAGRPATSSAVAKSARPTTPVSDDRRSSPKVGTPISSTPSSRTSTPTMPMVVERNAHAQRPPAMANEASQPSFPSLNSSFRQLGNNAPQPSAAASQFSMVVELSPFPTSTQKTSQASSSVPFTSSQPTSRRPQRPPTVMSSTVRESNTATHAPSTIEAEADSTDKPPQRVSRFKASRM